MSNQPPYPVTWEQKSSTRREWLAYCNECTRWEDQPCHHVRDFFRDKFELFHDPLPERSLIHVPVFFARATKAGGRTIEVSIGLRDDYGNAAVRLAHPENVEKDVIDVISRSSGVWAIRNSLLQYAFSQYKKIDSCPEPLHDKRKPLGPSDPRENDPKDPVILDTILALLETGKCRSCLNNKSNFVPDI